MSRYAPINGWTKQRIIAQIQLRNNGMKSVRGRNLDNCQYRGDNGNCCAVGCFIPNNEYSYRMEGNTVYRLLNEFKDLKRHMPLDVGALARLQLAHDHGTNEDVRERMIAWINENVKD